MNSIRYTQSDREDIFMEWDENGERKAALCPPPPRDAKALAVYREAYPDMLKVYERLVKEGVTVADYVVPEEPAPQTTRQKVERLAAVAGLTFDEFKAALAAKT